MKTTIILHGGFSPGKADENNSGFYLEILRYAPEGARILLVPFAKDSERVPAAVEKVTDEFTKNKWQKSISFELADESSFAVQVAHGPWPRILDTELVL